MVTLYTFRKSNYLYTVYRDDTNYALVNYYSTYSPGVDSQPPANTTISVVCVPGTYDQYSYKTQTAVPYVYIDINHDAAECGYVPPACDVAISSFTKSDQTATGVNDGSANLFCTSSSPPITYYLYTSADVLVTQNTTGLFTGLAPGDYYIKAYDTRLCYQIQTFTILAYDETSQTHWKYRLDFTSLDGLTSWELRLIDVFHNYDNTVYPIDITGQDEPIVKKVADPNEDKTTSIICTTLDINLEYTGNDFTIEEFIVPEQSWKVELYKDGVLDFQGWILPDETQNYYSDAPYAVTLTATDGLASLKGNLWGDGSGGQGYGSYQIAQYGFTSWALLVKQCLDQLGYDYGSTTIISSLQFAGTYDVNLWVEIGMWSDILYDSSGIPTDTYSALGLLLGGLKLSIVQHKGYFVLFNSNDLFYLNKSARSADFENAVYQLGPTFENIAETGTAVEQPLNQLIGKDYPGIPINPPQGINYDKAYNIKERVDFNSLALLFTNPSFEVGAVQGNLPPEFQFYGPTPTPAYCNYDPVIPGVTNSGAFDGVWELQTEWHTASGVNAPAFGSQAQLINPIVIDQPLVGINLSYQWRGNTPFNSYIKIGPSVALIFTETSTGLTWWWNNRPTPGPAWKPFTSESDIGALYVGDDATDNRWHNFTVQTASLPNSGIGTIQIMINGPGYVYTTGHELPAGTLISVSIDDLNITQYSTIVSSVNQVAEIHQTAKVVELPNSNIKNPNLNLFTFPTNKRCAGNIFYCPDISINYASGIVANTWNFALKVADPSDRLPATITRAYARNYARQMLKWEGDVKTNYLQFYGTFQVEYFDSKVFLAFSIESKLRSGIHHVVLIEIDDSDAQNVYTYTPVYENSARTLQ